VIGLLGGVGSGKSTLAAELARLGCAVVDADRIGHELLDEPDVREELRRLWGEGILDAAGGVLRPAVAEKVFSDPAGLAALNAIVHPRIGRRIAEGVAAALADPLVPAVVVDAALLLETDWHELCTDFVFVSADADLRAGRVRRQRAWGRRDWRRRENSQKSLDIKAAKADHVVDNSSSLSCLRDQAQAIFHRIVRGLDEASR
jgi:dephospho-CoA kinase